MNFFDEKQPLLSFTNAICELVSGGIPLEKAVKTVAEMDCVGRKVSAASSEILESLENGSSFFVSLEKACSIKFPAWYISFVGCSEKAGNLSDALREIQSILEKLAENRERFISAVSYPVFVAFASFGFAFFALHFVSSFQLGMENETNLSAFDCFFSPLIFLFSSYFCIFVLMRKIFGGNSLVLVFKSLSFLTENSVSVLDGIKNCFSFAEKDKKLETALLLSEERIQRGEKVAESFSRSFDEAGFKNESKILGVNLSLCQMTGKNDGFSRTLKILEKRRNQKIKKFLASLNPCLMFITAIYLSLLLRKIFLPMFLGFGGEL